MMQTGWDAQSCQRGGRVAILTLPGWFAAAIKRDGMVATKSFSFGDGSNLFNPCKAMDPVIEDVASYGELKFLSPIFS